MSKGVKSSGLDQTLSGRGPFTVFAPTDLAFRKLAAGSIEELLNAANKVKLVSLLNNHVVEGKINLKDLKDGDTLKSLEGNELSVKVTESKVSVNGAAVENRGVQTTNGVIFSLDTVLQN